MPLQPKTQSALDQALNHLFGLFTALKQLDPRLERQAVSAVKAYIEEYEKPAPRKKAKAGGES